MIATASPLCGIANLPNQRHKISIKKGINYTILVVGQSGSGKTTFINTLLATSISKGEDYTKRHRSTDKTTHITLTKAVIEENLFKVKLTIVDTPGFGDYINNNETWAPIIDFIDTQYQSYFYQEQQPDRSLLNDVRVNVCLYFVNPTSHGLSPLDIQAMKQIGSRCNLIPIIAKADTFSPRNLQEYKERIRQTLVINQIQVYSPNVDHSDPIDSKIGSEILDAMPFSVIGSEENVRLSDGTQVRGRQYPWGTVQVENDNHCDFRKLRNLLIRTHMLELINSTDAFHYDKFKTSYLEQGGADKNKKENPKFKEEEEALRRKFTEQVRIEEARFRQWELKLIAERDRLNRDLEVEHVVVRQLEAEIESLQASQLQNKNTYRN